MAHTATLTYLLQLPQNKFPSHTFTHPASTSPHNYPYTHTHTCWCCNTATATVTHTHYTHTLTHTRTHALTHTCLPPHYHTATCVLYITHAAPTSRNLTCSQTHLHTQLGLAGRAAQAAGPEPPGSSTADGKHSFPTVASQ